MKIPAVQIAVVLLLTACFCLPAYAAPKRAIRLGILDNPGSKLCRLAVTNGLFREEGLRVELIPFADSNAGLAALKQGSIDVGAFGLDDSHRGIASGAGFKVIAGGGTQLAAGPLADLDEGLKTEGEIKGVVVLIPRKPTLAKERLIRLTSAIIRAYRTTRLHPQQHDDPQGERFVYDPNPEYYRIERIWRHLKLQQPEIKRDFLASHIYEEIYCDALDRVRDKAPDDPVYRELSSKAVCTPDCCPKKKKKK